MGTLQSKRQAAAAAILSGQSAYAVAYLLEELVREEFRADAASLPEEQRKAEAAAHMRRGVSGGTAGGRFVETIRVQEAGVILGSWLATS